MKNMQKKMTDHGTSKQTEGMSSRDVAQGHKKMPCDHPKPNTPLAKHKTA